MAITLLGEPQEFTPGYNPIYFYADSDKKTNDAFRYVVEVYNLSTSTTLGTLKLKPRFGDGYLAVNIQKILAGDLSDLGEDIDLNNVVTGFNNSASSGFQYRLSIGEEYVEEWAFADTQFESGIVRLVGVDTFTFVNGSSVNVEGAAEAFAFTDNNFDSGNVAFVSPGHTINIGDTVYIQQTQPYTFQAYEGYHTVTNTTATLVTIDVPFQGNTPAEPGTLYRNYQYDGLQTVTATGVVASGPYTGYNYIDLDQAWIDNSPTNPGTVTYSDNRVIEDLGQDITTAYTFNGAEGHNTWPTWVGLDYDSSGTGQKFLTTLPDNWTVSLDDDVFLNVWGEAQTARNYKGILKTYDINDVLIGEWEWINPNLITQTQIQTVTMGPNWFNSAATTSPPGITNITGPAVPIDCDVAYYTVNVETLFAVEQTDFRTFYVDCSCIGRFTNYPVLFMDRFGSFVPFDFSLANRQRVNVDREQYKRFIGELSSGAYSYSLAESSHRTFDTNLVEKWTIRTDWLTETESLFFEELVTSPVALIQVEGTYRAIQITEKNYERRRKVNDKNIRYDLDIMMANPNTVQGG